MSTQILPPEVLAKAFFHYHEALGPDFGCSSDCHPNSWDDLSERERARMVAAARLALLEIRSELDREEDERSRYFAKPGTAEWGC